MCSIWIVMLDCRFCRHSDAAFNGKRFCPSFSNLECPPQCHDGQHAVIKIMFGEASISLLQLDKVISVSVTTSVTEHRL